METTYNAGTVTQVKDPYTLYSAWRDLYELKLDEAGTYTGIGQWVDAPFAVLRSNEFLDEVRKGCYFRYGSRVGNLRIEIRSAQLQDDIRMINMLLVGEMDGCSEWFAQVEMVHGSAHEVTEWVTDMEYAWFNEQD